jgi:hypothetical protein
MKPVRVVVFVVALTLIAGGGYLPWYYAGQHETFRVEVSPLFASEFCSPFGLLLKTMSIITWVGGFVSFFTWFPSEGVRWQRLIEAVPFLARKPGSLGH